MKKKVEWVNIIMFSWNCINIYVPEFYFIIRLALTGVKLPAGKM
jgi:hypothetical protein